MNEVVEVFVEIAARLVEGYCLYILFGKFGRQKIKGKIASGVITILTWVFVSKAISCFVFMDSSLNLGRRMLSLIMRMAAAYLMGVAFYHVKHNVLLFIVLLFTSFTYIASQISYGVNLCLIFGINQMAMRIDAMNNQVFVCILITVFGFMKDLLTIILPLLSAKYLIKHNKHNLNERKTKEIISYMMPAIIGCFASIILYFVFFIINAEGNIFGLEKYVWIYLPVTVVFVAIWLAILYSFKLQQEVIGLQEEQTQKSILENQISQMQNSMMEMEDFYKGIRHIKHDMKNQMAIIEKLVNENQITENDEITQFFGDMQKTLGYLEQRIHTGNTVSDAVIGTKFHYAEKEIPGIHLDAEDFLLTDKVQIRPYDMGIILNNGLDNAIEACKNLRLNNPDADVYIKIKSFWKQRMFFIEIENSFDGKIEWDAEGYPSSTKPDARLHGIGMKNIRYCAVKYMGDIDCIAKKDKFILSVMLKG